MKQFQDMLAIFEGPTTPSQRVQLLLKVLGGSRMQVDVTALEKAPPDENQAPPPQKRSRRTRGRGRRIKDQLHQPIRNGGACPATAGQALTPS